MENKIKRRLRIIWNIISPIIGLLDIAFCIYIAYSGNYDIEYMINFMGVHISMIFAMIFFAFTHIGKREDKNGK